MQMAAMQTVQLARARNLKEMRPCSFEPDPPSKVYINSKAD